MANHDKRKVVREGQQTTPENVESNEARVRDVDATTHDGRPEKDPDLLLLIARWADLSIADRARVMEIVNAPR